MSLFSLLFLNRLKLKLCELVKIEHIERDEACLSAIAAAMATAALAPGRYNCALVTHNQV